MQKPDGLSDGSGRRTAVPGLLGVESHLGAHTLFPTTDEQEISFEALTVRRLRSMTCHTLTSLKRMRWLLCIITGFLSCAAGSTTGLSCLASSTTLRTA